MPTRTWSAPPIDWSPPDGPEDWLLGSGTTRTERVTVWTCVVVGTLAVAVVAVHEDVRWRWWEWALVLVLAVDVVGGVPANALSTAKRLYHARPEGTTVVSRLVRHPLAFSALHVHPFVLAAVVPQVGWAWAASWYLTYVVGTAVVVGLPLYVHRPAASAVGALALVLAPLLVAPEGLAWLGPLLVLKLVVAHAVREEPYRPGPMTTTRQDSTDVPASS